MEAARLRKPKECAIAVHACDGNDGSGGSDGHGGDGDSSADVVPTSVRPCVPHRHKSTEYPPSRRTTLREEVRSADYRKLINVRRSFCRPYLREISISAYLRSTHQKEPFEHRNPYA